jgi:hypothetical protein
MLLWVPISLLQLSEFFGRFLVVFVVGRIDQRQCNTIVGPRAPSTRIMNSQPYHSQ